MSRDELLRILDTIDLPECAPAVERARRGVTRLYPFTMGTVAGPAHELPPSEAARGRFLEIASRFVGERWFMHLVMAGDRYFTIFSNEQGVGRACFDSADDARRAPAPDRDAFLRILDTFDNEFRTVVDKARRLVAEGVPIVGGENTVATPGLRSLYAIRATYPWSPSVVTQQCARFAEVASRFPDEGWCLYYVTTELSSISVWANEQGIGRVCMDVGPDVRVAEGPHLD